MPRGKINITLVKGTDLKLNSESFNQPVLEFRLDNQRVMIDESINPLKASWNKGNLIEFETGSQWDTLEVRVFTEQTVRIKDFGTSLSTEKVSNLYLLGAFQKTLSSIYVDDEKSSIFNIDLWRVNE